MAEGMRLTSKPSLLVVVGARRSPAGGNIRAGRSLAPWALPWHLCAVGEQAYSPGGQVRAEHLVMGDPGRQCRLLDPCRLL